MLLILFCVHFSYHAWANQLTFLMADTNTYQSEIQKVNKVYGEAFIKGDSSLFINCYSPDACIMPPNAPIICGIQGQLAF
ncbi:MAG: Ketosteroid isomerase, partial [Chitinophagaceae bacterium]|nr:Ketosteroid isomerase [Chitinophagaceae bacterium]